MRTTRSRCRLQVPPALHAEFTGQSRAARGGAHRINAEEVRRTYSLLNAPGEWPLRIAPRVHAPGADVALPRRGASGRTSSKCCHPMAASRRARPRAAAATWPSPPGVASPLCWPSVRTLLKQGAHSVVLFYGNTGTVAGHVRRGTAGAEGRAPGSPGPALRDEPRAAGGRSCTTGAWMRPGYANSPRTLFQPAQVREYFLCGPGDMIGRGQRRAAWSGCGRRAHPRRTLRALPPRHALSRPGRLSAPRARARPMSRR